MPFSPFDPRHPAKSSYSNADLPDFERQPLGTTVEQVGDPSPTSVIPDEEFNQAYGDRDAILNGAKAALAKGNRISGWLDAQSQQPDEATLAISQEVPSALDSPVERLKKLAMHYIKTRPEALEKGAYAGALSFPEIAIPAEAYLAGRSANRLAQGEDQSTLSKVGDVAQLAGSGYAAYRGLSGAISGLKAAVSPRARALNEFFTGHPEATSPAGGQLLREVDAGRQAEAATRAGEMSQNRMLARQQEAAGFTPAATQKITGLHPKAPRSISTASPVSHSSPFDYIGDLMDEVQAQRPVEDFAQGPQILRGQGSRTPEQAALYERATGGGPRENLNASINTTEARPRSTQGLMEALKTSAPESRAANASGESMASQEAINRGASMKAKGEQFVVMDRAGNMRPLIGPEAVDYVPRPGERYGTFSKNGFKLLQEGGKRAARR